VTEGGRCCSGFVTGVVGALKLVGRRRLPVVGPGDLFGIIPVSEISPTNRRVRRGGMVGRAKGDLVEDGCFLGDRLRGVGRRERDERGFSSRGRFAGLIWDDR